MNLFINLPMTILLVKFWSHLPEAMSLEISNDAALGSIGELLRQIETDNSKSSLLFLAVNKYVTVMAILLLS